MDTIFIAVRFRCRERHPIICHDNDDGIFKFVLFLQELKNLI